MDFAPGASPDDPDPGLGRRDLSIALRAPFQVPRPRLDRACIRVAAVIAVESCKLAAVQRKADPVCPSSLDHGAGCGVVAPRRWVRARCLYVGLLGPVWYLGKL